MGDGEKTPLKLNFGSKVRLEFRGLTLSTPHMVSGDYIYEGG